MYRHKSVIIQEFNDTINKLIKILELRCVSELGAAHLSTLRRRISWMRSLSNGAETMIVASLPYFEEHYEAIIDRKEEDVFGIDMRKRYGSRVSREDDYVFDLIEIVKATYLACVKTEQNALYSLIKTLADGCIEYKLSTTT